MYWSQNDHASAVHCDLSVAMFWGQLQKEYGMVGPHDAVAAPTTCHIVGLITNGSSALPKSLKSWVHSWIRFGTRFSKIRCMKSNGKDHGNWTDQMKLRTGTPFTPYSLASRSASALVDACCTCLPISRISSCWRSGKSTGSYFATVVSQAGALTTSGCHCRSSGT